MNSPLALRQSPYSSTQWKNSPASQPSTVPIPPPNGGIWTLNGIPILKNIQPIEENNKNSHKNKRIQALICKTTTQLSTKSVSYPQTRPKQHPLSTFADRTSIAEPQQGNVKS